VEIAKRHSAGHSATAQDLPIFGRQPLALKPMAEIRSSYYLRVSALDQPAVLAQVAGILGRHEISIASVIQKTHQRARAVPVVMMTHEAQEGNMQKAIEENNALPVIAAPTRMIRVEQT
jgi:homoserine dehydrogenase